MADQIDIITGRTTPHLHLSYGFRWDVQFAPETPSEGDDLSANIGPAWTISRDSERGNSTMTLPVTQPFTITAELHHTRLYAGWNQSEDSPTVQCGAGSLDSDAPVLVLPGNSLQISGYLKLMEQPLGSYKAFVYVGDTIEATVDRAADFAAWEAAWMDGTGTIDPATAAIIDQVPDGYQLVPIFEDADAIIHIIESYNVRPETTGHSIEATPYPIARLSPILMTDTMSGRELIRQIDEPTPWRTFDGRLGDIKRRQVYGVAPTEVVHVYTKGVDVMAPGPTLQRTFRAINQVKVIGAYNPTTGENLVAYWPHATDDPETPATPSPNAMIWTPPGVSTLEIRAPFIETIPGLTDLAEMWYDVRSITWTEFDLPVLLESDRDIGDYIGVDFLPVLFDNAVITAITHTGSSGESTLSIRLAVYR